MGCGGGLGKMEVEVGGYDFGGNLALVERIVGTPHGYFRFINRQFAGRVCEMFAEDVARLPPVNLHGDAHLEQYAVTEMGYGLADFDDAAVGPAAIDLVRFGVSLRLAGEELGWGEGIRSGCGGRLLGVIGRGWVGRLGIRGHRG